MKNLKIVITLTDIKDLQSAKDILSDVMEDIGSMDGAPTVNAEVVEEEVHQRSFQAGKSVS